MHRNADTRIQSYLRQVDQRMTALVGVPFSDIQGDVEESAGINLVSKMNGGMSPDGFAQLLCETFPLQPVSGFGDPAQARGANVAVMALASFVRENPDWVQGSDGAAYRDSDGGVSRLAFGRSPDGSADGFVASHADGAELGLDERLRPVADGVDFVPMAGGRDLGDAVERLNAALESVYSTDRGMGMHV